MLAGIYDPSAQGQLSAVRRALAPEGQADTRGLGALQAGSAGNAVGSSGDIACFLDGVIHNLDDVAGELGLGPEVEPAGVIAAGYRRLGPGLFSRLRGSYAAALWDSGRDCGALVQDQLGGRSMFLAEVGGRLVFASELRALLRLLDRAPGPDRVALLHFLARLGVARERTLYEGVTRLAGGHWLEIVDGRWCRKPYWRPRFAPPLRSSPDELAEALGAEMEASVERRLTSVGSSGITLSGGFDSSSIAALAAGVSARKGTPVRAYSSVFPDHPETDESPFIERVTDTLGLPSGRARIQPEGGLLALSLEYLRAWKAPLIAPGYANEAPLLGQAVKDGVSVVLDGQGGDELFGPSPYLLADRLLRGRLVSLVRLARAFPAVSLLGGSEARRPSVHQLASFYGLRGASPVWLTRRRWQRNGRKGYAPSYFDESGAQLLVDTSEPWAWRQHDGPRWWAWLAHEVTEMREEYGMPDYLNRRAALAGLSASSPWITDVDLVEFVLRLPPEVGFDRHLNRPLARRAMRGRLDDAIRLRQGKGNFTTFAQDCVASELDTIRALLGEGAEVGAYVDLKLVESVLLDGAPVVGGPSHGAWTAFMWRLIAAECWLRSLADPSFPDAMLQEDRLPRLRSSVSSAPPTVRSRRVAA